jgi:hypothetical protein
MLMCGKPKREINPSLALCGVPRLKYGAPAAGFASLALDYKPIRAAQQAC